jgi:phosphodiesterase/alkaline phosphatase D-like protein
MSTTRFSQLHPRQSWWIRLFVAVLVMAGLMTIGVGHSAAAPDRQGALHKVYITDVRDNQFVVSWTTDTPSNGQVEWGTTTALGSTTADGVASTTTHYVVITGLAPSTVYYFQVRSGSLVDNNHGSYYTVTTGRESLSMVSCINKGE